MSKTGLLFIVVGPAAAGKNTLINDALAHLPALRQMPTATTRPRRPGEKNGRERFFVTPEAFQQMIENDALLEWQEVHPDRLYGVPRDALEAALENGEYLIADIDVLGATYIRSAYPDNVLLIFVKPNSVQELAQRMQMRGDDQDDIPARLKRVAMEMEYLPVADYVVVNDAADLEQAARHFRSIIEGEIQLRSPAKRQFEHQVVTIPIYQDDVLWHTEAPHFLETTLKAREVPHRAALRSLEEDLGCQVSVDHLLRIKSNRGSFVSPVQVAAHDEGVLKYITLTYVYLLPERISVTDAWIWLPRDSVPLPDTARQILREMSD